MDGEIVICEKENIESAAGGATEHSKGLVVKFMYNAVTVNQDLVSHFEVDRKVNDFKFKYVFSPNKICQNVIFRDQNQI